MKKETVFLLVGMVICGLGIFTVWYDCQMKTDILKKRISVQEMQLSAQKQIGDEAAASIDKMKEMDVSVKELQEKVRALSLDTRIAEPADRGTVTASQMFKGTLAWNHKDKEIWTVVQPDNESTYHPQINPVLKEGVQSWTIMATMGEKSGEAYSVYLVSATTNASAAFRSYIDEAQKSDKWDGMEELPSGAEVLDHIQVTQQ